MASLLQYLKQDNNYRKILRLLRQNFDSVLDGIEAATPTPVPYSPRKEETENPSPLQVGYSCELEGGMLRVNRA